MQANDGQKMDVSLCPPERDGLNGAWVTTSRNSGLCQVAPMGFQIHRSGVSSANPTARDRESRGVNLKLDQLGGKLISTLARINWSIYRFGLVSNQGGVEGGFLSEKTALRMLMDCALEVLPEEVHPHIQKGAIQLCPHLPKTGCWCRKPLPTLLNDVMQVYHAEPISTVYVGDLETDEQAAQAAGCGFQWIWDFCGKSAEDWTHYLAARHQAEPGPAWVDSPDGTTMVMRLDRGACPRCKVGTLRPQITTDGSAYFADRCDACRASWWTQTPKTVPSRFLPID